MILKSSLYQSAVWGRRPRGRIAMLSLVVWAGLVISAGSDDAPPYKRTLPFEPGERLSYDLRWTIVPAGHAVLEVLPMALVDGQQSYHFRLTVKSNAFVDLIYKVRDRIDSYVNQEVTHALRYLKKQEEGEHRRNESVEFDWAAGVAHHDNGEKQTVTELPSGTFDPLSAFYYVRTLTFTEKDVLKRPVTDGVTTIMGRARVVKRQVIELFDDSYDTYLLEPSMEKIGGVFEKEKGAKIKLWVTADHRHIPVKIASKISIGHFVGELVGIETASRSPDKTAHGRYNRAASNR